jgi:hypothetical protein
MPTSFALQIASRNLWLALTAAERKDALTCPAGARKWSVATQRLDAAFGSRGAWLTATAEQITARLAEGGHAADHGARDGDGNAE